MLENKVLKLKEIIKSRAIATNAQYKMLSPDGWVIDIKNIVMDPIVLSLIVDIFWQKFENQYPFQIGGQETTSLPIIAAIICKGQQIGKPVSGFYIRKSRKKTDLQKILEGSLNNEKIILIDDIINSGRTIERQIKILEKEGKKINSIFALVLFKEKERYEFFHSKNIHLSSLFALDDFGLKLNEIENNFLFNYFNVLWYFQSPNPDLFHLIPKSTPAIDNKRIYFGSDSGCFWALNQKDGSVAWKYKVWWFKQKGIFSSPAIFKDNIYFGSYDGNVYCLDKKTGKRKWVFMEADWVGSSPTIAENLGLLLIGLEFGLINKHGGIAALDLETGKKIWEYKMPLHVHCSPAYWHEKKIVAVGCNDGKVYLLNAKKGNLLWEYQTDGHIKYGLAFDKKRNYLVFGSLDGFEYFLNVSNGSLVRKYETEAGIISAPLIYKGNYIFSSLDKRVYNLNPEKKEPNWIFETHGRILSSPVLIEGNIFIGSNDGRIYEIDPETGRQISYFQTAERILNSVVYNPNTKRFFVSTQANEIYCLTRQYSTNLFVPK